jgi:hypothetical protein
MLPADMLLGVAVKALIVGGVTLSVTRVIVTEVVAVFEPKLFAAVNV